MAKKIATQTSVLESCFIANCSGVLRLFRGFSDACDSPKVRLDACRRYDCFCSSSRNDRSCEDHACSLINSGFRSETPARRLWQQGMIRQSAMIHRLPSRQASKSLASAETHAPLSKAKYRLEPKTTSCSSTDLIIPENQRDRRRQLPESRGSECLARYSFQTSARIRMMIIMMIVKASVKLPKIL